MGLPAEGREGWVFDPFTRISGRLGHPDSAAGSGRRPPSSVGETTPNSSHRTWSVDCPTHSFQFVGQMDEGGEREVPETRTGSGVLQQLGRDLHAQNLEEAVAIIPQKFDSSKGPV